MVAIDIMEKRELANGNYDVSFTIDGEPQLWLGVRDWIAEDDALFVAHVLASLEEPAPPEPEIPPLTDEELEAMSQ